MEGKITGVLYAVFRVGENRFKNLNNIKGFKAHMDREKETLNADPALKHLNKMIIGDEDIYKTVREQLKDCKLVKDANIAHELILTASREYFLNISQEQKELWVEANKKFLIDKFGDACIYAQLHCDETSWHIHALISNRTVNRWGKPTINNSVYFGGQQFKGREKLRKYQDDYAGAMAQFNLSRGVRFSKATHVKIKQYYALINDNMSMEKLNRVIDTAYKVNYIKEEFNAIAGRIEAHMRGENEPLQNISEVKKEIYKLSSLTTAPDRFYSEEKERTQRLKVNELLNDYGIPENVIDSIDLAQRETHKRRKETSLEAYARIVAETRIKREALELKKTLKKLEGQQAMNDKEREKMVKDIRDLKKDKEVYKSVLRTLSEYYCIPQEAIETVIKSAVGAEYKEISRGVERKFEK